MEVSCKLHAPATLAPGNITWWPLDKGGRYGRWQRKKTCVLSLWHSLYQWIL